MVTDGLELASISVVVSERFISNDIYFDIVYDI
jgi:hypothetical protein